MYKPTLKAFGFYLRLASITLTCLLLMGGKCDKDKKPTLNDGLTYTIRLQNKDSNFLKIDTSNTVIANSVDSNNQFTLFDLNRGDLLNGDEVLLLSSQDSYLLGDFSNDKLIAVSSGTGQNDFCNRSLTIQALANGTKKIESGTLVKFQVFDKVDDKSEACKSPTNRTPGKFLAISSASTPELVSSVTDDTANFTIHIDKETPYSITRNLSAPFASIKNFSRSNFVDLDWHKDTKIDFLGGDDTYDNHTGIDYGSASPGFRIMQEGGLSVLAVASGKVVYLRQDREDRCHHDNTTDKSTCPTNGPYDSVKTENEIIIKHDDGTVSVYAHIMKNSSPLREGDQVKCGQMIAKVGSAGGSDGPHLHFELRTPHDPDFWSKNPNSVSFPHFWDHSMIIDPYQIGAWGKLKTVPPIAPKNQQYIPLVTCESTETQRIWREDEDKFLRASLAKGYMFDKCDFQNNCGSNYFCNQDRGFCERKVQAGQACSNGNQCPTGYGCQNGVCGLGPNCSNQCPAYCFTNRNNQCVNRITKKSCALVCAPNQLN